MRKPTKIHHPALKQESTVDARAVHVWEASGWVQGPLPESGDAVETPSADAPSDEPAPAPGEQAPADKPGRSAKPKTPAVSPANPDA